MGKNKQAVIALACQIVKLRDRARIWKQTALTLENEAVSARADAVARAEADRVRIEGLAKELRLERETCTETADLLNRESEKVRGLSVQAQDQRSEIERLRDEAAKYKTERDHFYQREGIEAKKPMDVEDERDALRAEVAALQERLRASIARGDFAQMEVAALKSRTPQHPVKVGEWVRRLVPSPACDVGTVAKVVHVDDDTSEIEYDVKRIDGQHGVWFAKNCEPCDPPIVKREPTIGDTVRLVKIPIMGAVSPELQRVLEWPWIERWGTLNQTALVVEPAYQLEGALSVCLRTNVHVRWPVCCIEVVSEATHDTEAGKAAAESAAQHSAGIDIGTWSRKVTT